MRSRLPRFCDFAESENKNIVITSAKHEVRSEESQKNTNGLLRLF
ncbi:hypothetical protein ACWIUD_03075 [Helicobacter sp. 23-1044]